MTHPRPTFLSLFSGIGGLDLGLERAGWICIGQVEIDDFCQRVLARHWPDVPRWGDIREVNPDDLPRADLIAGGFPCQPVSSAGKRLAQADERWLWPEMARVVRHLRPRWVLVENVPGLLARGMGDVLGELAASGYDAEWDCIPASAVGAPHRRDRVWIVAYPAGHGRQGQPAAPVRGQHDPVGRSELAGSHGQNGSVAHPNDKAWRLSAAGFPGAGSAPLLPAGPPQPGRRGSDVADPDGAGSGQGSRLGWPRLAIDRDGWWAAEPDVGRVAHGVPARLDRLGALGNAVVPQVAELIGRRILEAAV